MSLARQSARSVPVGYDSANYGQDIHFPLVDPKLENVQTFTMSASATQYDASRIQFIPSGTTSVSYTPMIHSTDSVLTDLDTGLIFHEGNNANFSQNYIISGYQSAVIQQLQISAAFALNVSAWVDGSPALEYVRFDIASYQSDAAPFMPEQTVIFRPVTAFTPLSAAGAHLFILRNVIDLPFEVMPKGRIVINIQVSVSGTSANDTYQIGILDMYPIHKTTAAKRLFPSEIIAHLNQLPDKVQELNRFTEYELKGTGVMKYG